MAPIPTPLTWRRRSFAVFEPPDYGLRRLYAVAVSGLVAGPFAVYQSSRSWFTLVHLPSQAKIVDLAMQRACKDAAERFAALDLNWWTCMPREVTGPDLQEMRNIFASLKPDSWVPIKREGKPC